MSHQTLEERIRELEAKASKWESLLPRLQALLDSDGLRVPDRDAWKKTIGMFTNDPVMDQIDDETRKIREQDREQTAG